MSDFPMVNTTNIVIVLGNKSSDCQKETVDKKPEELDVEEKETWMNSIIKYLYNTQLTAVTGIWAIQ